MTPQQIRGLAHFIALFLSGFGGWIAFSLVNTGAMYPIAGVIVAALIAYGGTLFALRVSAGHDLRPTYRPNAHVYDSLRTTAPLPRIQQGRLMMAPSGPPRYDVDAAAGD
jgi:hypothetical protein